MRTLLGKGEDEHEGQEAKSKGTSTGKANGVPLVEDENIPDYADKKDSPAWRVERREQHPTIRFLQIPIVELPDFKRRCTAAGLRPTLERAYSEKRDDAFDTASYAVTDEQLERLGCTPWHASRDRGEAVEFAVHARRTEEFDDQCEEAGVKPALQGVYASSRAEKGTWDVGVYSLPRAAAEKLRNGNGTVVARVKA